MGIFRLHVFKVSCIVVDGTIVEADFARLGGGYGEEDAVGNVHIDVGCGLGWMKRSEDATKECSCQVIVSILGKG